MLRMVRLRWCATIITLIHLTARLNIAFVVPKCSSVASRERDRNALSHEQPIRARTHPPPHGEHARIRFIGASQKTCVRASHRMHRCMALSALHRLARGIHTTTPSSAAGGLRYGRIFCCRLCGICNRVKYRLNTLLIKILCEIYFRLVICLDLKTFWSVNIPSYRLE